MQETHPSWGNWGDSSEKVTYMNSTNPTVTWDSIGLCVFIFTNDIYVPRAQAGALSILGLLFWPTLHQMPLSPTDHLCGLSATTPAEATLSFKPSVTMAFKQIIP
jgi:hypothetical protein